MYFVKTIAMTFYKHFCKKIMIYDAYYFKNHCQLNLKTTKTASVETGIWAARERFIFGDTGVVRQETGGSL